MCVQLCGQLVLPVVTFLVVSELLSNSSELRMACKLKWKDLGHACCQCMLYC